MAIEHMIEAAKHNELHASAKWVLAAIADDTSRDTRISFPGEDKLVEWGGVSPRRVASILEELIARQLIARRRFGHTGVRTEYLWAPTPEELEKLDNIDPRLNRVSQEAIDRVELADLRLAVDAAKDELDIARRESRRQKTDAAAAAVHAAIAALDVAENALAEAKARHAARKTGSDQPVENAEKRVPSVAPRIREEGATGDGEGATGGTPLLRNSPRPIPQSVENSHQRPVDNSGTDSTKNSHPTPKPRRAGRPLDLVEVATAEARMLDRTGITEAGIARLCDEILASATTLVLDPTAYVIRSLRSDRRAEWERRAYDLAIDVPEPHGALF